MNSFAHYHCVIEALDNEGYSAYVLELPGCVGAEDSLEKLVAVMKEAISLHLELMESENGDSELKSQAHNSFTLTFQFETEVEPVLIR